MTSQLSEGLLTNPAERPEPSRGSDSWEAALAAAYSANGDSPSAVGKSILAALSQHFGNPPRVALRRTDGPLLNVSDPHSAERPPQAPGRFHLYGEIGRGGMGAIYFGRDTDLGRDLAIKVLLDRHRERAELGRRFLYEAQVAGQLEHPAIPPVYELGRLTDGRPFFAMKLVRGKTFAALLAERKSPSDDLPRHLEILTQVCQAMAYAHSRGVIHRDLKPSNVMVGPFGEVQLMDWGLAKVLPQGGAHDDRRHESADATVAWPEGETERDTERFEEMGTRAGSIVGTPAYMSPEQAKGDVAALDERSDVFCLGAMLCEILTGQPPYTGSSASAVRDEAAQGNQADARRRLADCPVDKELIALAEACLAPLPADRPRNAAEVAERLAAYRQSVEQRLRDAELATAGARAKAVEERKRRRLSLALVLVLAATIASATGGSVWWYQQRQQEIRDVESAVAQAAAHRNAERWNQMRVELDRAAARMGPGTPKQLREEFDRLEKDLAMVDDLKRVADGTRTYDYATTVRTVERGNFEISHVDTDFQYPCHEEYLKTFRAYGIDAEKLSSEEMAARIKASSIRQELVGALLHWARMSRADAWRDKLLAAAIAESDSPWRRDFCTADRALDRTALSKLSQAPEAFDERPGVLWYAGIVLKDARLVDEAIIFMRRAQRRVPSSFWLNCDLAMVLQEANPPRMAESIGYLHAATAIHSDSPNVYLNLSNRLRSIQDLDGAVYCARRAIELGPRNALAHNILGRALTTLGRQPEALASYRESFALDPDGFINRLDLANALVVNGNLAEAFPHFERTIETRPDYPLAHLNYGRALASSGNYPAAIERFKKAIEVLPEYPEAYEALADALRTTGYFEASLRALETELAQGSRSKDLAQRLREGKRLVELDAQLSQVLRGDLTPSEPSQTVSLAEFAQVMKKRYVASQKLYAQAFAAQLQFANDMQYAFRYNAACAAALAAAGEGNDAQELTDDERKELRTVSLQWLKDDLAARKSVADEGDGKAKQTIAAHFEHLQKDPDFATVRDAAALAKLPEDERAEWQALWKEVESLRKSLLQQAQIQE